VLQRHPPVSNPAYPPRRHAIPPEEALRHAATLSAPGHS